ncbi:hypothetical protein Tco_0537408, partial [Tanacetum coccineum]
TAADDAIQVSAVGLTYYCYTGACGIPLVSQNARCSRARLDFRVEGSTYVPVDKSSSHPHMCSINLMTIFSLTPLGCSSRRETKFIRSQFPLNSTVADCGLASLMWMSSSWRGLTTTTLQ